LNMLDPEKLETKAEAIRKSVMETAVRNGAGHIAPSLSCIEILTVLYYAVMKYDPRDPLWEERDRLIFSKGHGCYGLYALLADLGVIPAAEWENFNTPRSSLAGCVEYRPEYGLEAGCGSLGHGLPMAAGLALGARLRGRSYHVFCVTGDGELQEGTTWEALQFAVKHRLANLTLIVDKNGLQAMDFTSRIMDTGAGDLENRLRGFGVAPVVVDGHDVRALLHVLAASREHGDPRRPAAVVARTVKGRGVSCMENVPRFHYRVPTPEELAKEE